MSLGLSLNGLKSLDSWVAEFSTEEITEQISSNSIDSFV